jgi:hypothetical protein
VPPHYLAVEPALRCVRFPFPAESGELRPGLISESVSSEFSEFAQRLCAAGAAPDAIWQRRAFADVALGYFECAAVTHDCAAFIAPPADAQPRRVQFLRYRDGAGWRRAQAAADAICVGPDIAWVLYGSVVRGVPLAGAGPLVPAKLGAFGSGSLARFQDGVVAGFPTCLCELFVRRRAAARRGDRAPGARAAGGAAGVGRRDCSRAGGGRGPLLIGRGRWRFGQGQELRTSWLHPRRPISAASRDGGRGALAATRQSEGPREKALAEAQNPWGKSQWQCEEKEERVLSEDKDSPVPRDLSGNMPECSAPRLLQPDWMVFSKPSIALALSVRRWIKR